MRQTTEARLHSTFRKTASASLLLVAMVLAGPAVAEFGLVFTTDFGCVDRCRQEYNGTIDQNQDQRRACADSTITVAMARCRDLKPNDENALVDAEASLWARYAYEGCIDREKSSMSVCGSLNLVYLSVGVCSAASNMEDVCDREQNVADLAADGSFDRCLNGCISVVDAS